MNIRIRLAILGLVLTLGSGILLQFWKTSIALQLCVGLGMAIGFLAVGSEFFYYESPLLDKYTSRRAKMIIGIIFVTLGIGMLLLITRALLRMID